MPKEERYCDNCDLYSQTIHCKTCGEYCEYRVVQFYVYVIRLDDEILNVNKYMNRNPDYIDGKPCYYVGQSKYEPDVRFQQHKNGIMANKYAQEFGLYLSKKKYEKYNPIETREEAEETEEWLANRLQSKGYGVWWG